MHNCLKLAVLGTVAVLCQAGHTKTWQQSERADFEKGAIKNLSLRSDGRLTLAPQFRERFDSSLPYLWALARDGEGNLYTGGGPGAKLYRVSPRGEKKMLAEFEALEVHAIVVDRKNQIYVATSPDGKVYRVPRAGGKPEVFYDPRTKYIWALALDSKGELVVATGDPGQIHRVTADGKGSVLLRSEETHLRSLAVDAQDNLIVGTEPDGLVLRVSPAGEGFVLFQTPKKEVTAVTVQIDGTIYAATTGRKQSGSSPSLAPPVPIAPSPASAASLAGPPRATAPPPPSLSLGSTVVSGGSEVYHIAPDGEPRKVWTHASDIVYALGFDAGGRLLIGTGNKGSIYRLDSDHLYTWLLDATPTQVTSFCAGPGGSLYVATSNIGKVFEVASALEPEGSIESDVLDAGVFSLWGRLSFEAGRNGGRVSLMTRSGNLDRPGQNWSPWSAAITSPDGGRITSPPARFLQWKAVLAAGGAGKSPELDSVEVAYLPKNVAPVVEQIEVTPANYRFLAPAAAASPSPQTLTLPPLGRPHAAPSFSIETGSSTLTMQYAKGYIGARWNASDENIDTLTYTVYIRGVKETEWKLLRDKVKEKYMSWDSTAFPDGEYRLRVIASDLPSNPPQQALSGELEGDVFIIDNTPPRVTGLAASRAGTALEVRWKAADALNIISKAEYSLDGGEWTVTQPVTKLSDSRELDYQLRIEGVGQGEHTVAVRVEDAYDNQATEKAVVR